jgi:hypothetical protein
VNGKQNLEAPSDGFIDLIPFIQREADALLSAPPRPRSPVLEPSLTLCDRNHFFAAAGDLSRSIAQAVEATTTYAELADSAPAAWQIRWTSTFLWVDAGQVPAARHEWHVDRLGPGWTDRGRELADYSFNFALEPSRPFLGTVAYAWPDSEGLTSAITTEFLDERHTVTAPGFPENPRCFSEAVTRAIGVTAGPRRVISHEPGELSWIGPRTLHRAPLFHQSAWRLFVRVGLYREPHSPFVDHRLLCHRMYEPATGRTIFRPVGTQESLANWDRRLSVRL